MKVDNKVGQNPHKYLETTSSPCTGLCRIDEISGLCVGCGRTRAEIAGWRAMSEPERRAIMAVLARRTGRGSVQGAAD
ncbi:DUF1289 domain-containing protein [uncultured Rhodoblastus sp.]|uniref:DUF1289 domain-containing protein n=1 Tax=uncultured Rhodoblastus sp. TaxID=543037 RepID=UPI0025DD71E3|nr:DUF1289 domain-containing protein [uncultured Rhodoblastus sp.]